MGHARERPLPLPLPEDLARERGTVLAGVLRELPSELLVALLHGLRRHADCLVAGKLTTREGGCAVGVMLRELGPQQRPGARASRPVPGHVDL